MRAKRKTYTSKSKMRYGAVSVPLCDKYETNKPNGCDKDK